MPLFSKLSIYVIASIALAGMIIYQNVIQGNVPLSLAITRLANSKSQKVVVLNAIFAIVLATITSVIKFFFGEMREMERYVNFESFLRNINFPSGYNPMDKAKNFIICFYHADSS